MQKLNLGCGNKKLDGFLNIDINPNFEPDKVVDLEKGKLPFKDNSIDYVVANYVLEYIGDGFCNLIKEIYRVCESGATVEIMVTHPRHDDFIDDFNHKRAISLTLLKTLGKKFCSWYKDFYSGKNGLGDELNVDFEFIAQDYLWDEMYTDLVKNNKLQDLMEISKRFNNVIKAIKVKMVVLK